MSTTWTLTAQDICTDGLKHCSAIANNETPSAADMQLALRALDGLLKTMPLAGYNWPKLSGEVPLVWTGIQTMALPADYYSYPVVWILYLGQKIQLKQISHAYWVKLTNKTTTAPIPNSFYIDPAGTLFLWPVPPGDPVATIQYQKVINDTVQGSMPDVMQIWLNPLGWGVASEIAMDLGVPAPDRAELAQRWGAKKTMAMENSIPSEIITISVSD